MSFTLFAWLLLLLVALLLLALIALGGIILHGIVCCAMAQDELREDGGRDLHMSSAPIQRDRLRSTIVVR